MKKLLIILSVLCIRPGAAAQEFDKWFENSTLRLDYVFCGKADGQEIRLLEALRTGEWAGRTTRLSESLLKGNGQISLTDPESGEVLYVQSFSTLFQEWLGYEEATRTGRAFENCFQVPFPRKKVLVTLNLYDMRGRQSVHFEHEVDPADILIRRVKDNGMPRREIAVPAKDDSGIEGGRPKLTKSKDKTIEVAILAEGYTAGEQAKFYSDAEKAVKAIMSHSPFDEYGDRFRFTAVAAPSEESGVSIPRKGLWKRTVAGAHFDTFYTERYLTSSRMRDIYDALGTIPFEHIILLVNTPIYGGGGIFNSLTIIGSDNSTFDVVLVHEFGHAFGGLGDEYFYDDMFESFYPAGTEPWEPNITTLTDFASKWQDMLPEGTPVPTPVDSIEKKDVRKIWKKLSPEQKAALNGKLGVYEGGGYQSKGVYRPAQECRMKINECEEFCPVCKRAIRRMIDYSTGR